MGPKKRKVEALPSKKGRNGRRRKKEDSKYKIEENKITNSQIDNNPKQPNETMSYALLQELGGKISKISSRCSRIQDQLEQGTSYWKMESPIIGKNKAGCSPLCTPKKIFKSLMKNGSDDEGEVTFTPVRQISEGFQIFTSGVKFFRPELLQPLFTEDMIAPNKFGSKMYFNLTPENFRFSITQEIFCFDLLDENERAAIACSCLFLVSAAKDELLIRKAYRTIFESGYWKFQNAHFETILRNWGVGCIWEKDLIESQHGPICVREDKKETLFDKCAKEKVIRRLKNTESTSVICQEKKLEMENFVKTDPFHRRSSRKRRYQSVARKDISFKNQELVVTEKSENETELREGMVGKPSRKSKGKVLLNPNKKEEKKDCVEDKCISPSLINVELALDCIARSLSCFCLQELRMAHFKCISISMDPTLCHQSHVTLHFLAECQHRLLAAGVTVADLASDFTHFDFPNSVMAILLIAPKTSLGVKIASMAAAMALSRFLEYPLDSEDVTFGYFGEQFKSSGEKILDMPSSLAFKCFLLLDFILSTLDPNDEDMNTRKEAVKKIQEVMLCKMRYCSTEISCYFSTLSMQLERYVSNIHYIDEKT